MKPGDGVPPVDTHLEAALRHAPDAELKAPPLLRARIIAAAQRSADEAKRLKPWWRRLDEWLTPARLGGAGTAAAALLAATVLWVGRDEQPAAPERRALERAPAQDGSSTTAAVIAPAAAPAVAPAVAPAGSPAAAPVAEADNTATTAPTALARRERPAQAVPPVPPTPPIQPTPPAPSPAPAAAARPAPPPAQDGARAGQPVDRMSDRSSRERVDAPAMRAEEQVPRAGGHATTRVDESARQAAPAAALPLPSPPTALRAPRAPPPPSVRDAQEAAPAESGIRARRQGDADARVAAAAPGPTPFPAAPAPQREAAQSARGAGPGADALASAASPPLAATWLAAADPSAWRRRAPGGDEAALRAGWLAQLVAVTQGRWTAIPVGAATQGETWTLLHPGGLRGRVILLAAAVIVCDAQGARCEQAPLGETALGSLREALLR